MIAFGRKFDFFDGGSPEDGSFADRGFGLPIDFKASGSRAGGGGPKHAKEGTNAMHAGWTGPLSLIPVRPPNVRLDRGLEGQSIHRFAACKVLFTTKTFQCQERHFAVGRGFVLIDAQLVFQVVKHGRVTAGFTRHGLAHGHHMTSYGFNILELFVERNGVQYFTGGEVQKLRDFNHGLVRDAPFVVLQVVQDGQQRPTTFGIAGNEFFSYFALASSLR